MADWKRRGVCAVALAVAGVWAAPELPIARTFAQPAAPWNSHAVEGSFAGVRVREIDASNSAIVFLYDLNNQTDADYQLTKGPAVKIMSRLKSTGSLSSEKPVALNDSAFVPSRNRTRISVEIKQPFLWPGRMDSRSEDRIRRLVADEVGDIEGFVLFDGSTRYQIDLPGGWPEQLGLNTQSGTNTPSGANTRNKN
jgi:hypothetical protein